MTKLKAPDADELAEFVNGVEDVQQQAADFDRRWSSDYTATVADPIGLARTLAAAARDLAQLSVVMLGRHAMQEQKREIERLRRTEQ